MDIEKVKIENKPGSTSPRSKEQAAEHLMKTCKAGKVDSLADKGGYMQPKVNPFQTFFRMAQVLQGDYKRGEKSTAPPAANEPMKKTLNSLAAKFKAQPVVEGKIAKKMESDEKVKSAPAVECVLSDTKETNGATVPKVVIEEKIAVEKKPQDNAIASKSEPLPTALHSAISSAKTEKGKSPEVVQLSLSNAAATQRTISPAEEKTVAAEVSATSKSSPNKTSLSPGHNKNMAKTSLLEEDRLSKEPQKLPTPKKDLIPPMKEEPVVLAQSLKEPSLPQSEQHQILPPQLQPQKGVTADSTNMSLKRRSSAPQSATNNQLPASTLPEPLAKRRTTDNSAQKRKSGNTEITIPCPSSEEIASIINQLRKDIDAAQSITSNTKKTLEELAGMVKTHRKVPTEERPTTLYKVINGLLVPPVSQVIVNNQVIINECTTSYDISMESPTLSKAYF